MTVVVKAAVAADGLVSKAAGSLVAADAGCDRLTNGDRVAGTIRMWSIESKSLMPEELPGDRGRFRRANLLLVFE